MKTYVDAAKLQEYTTKLVAKLKTIFTGTPQPAATVADMTDHDKLYVYTGSETGYSAGNLYYWDGTAWTSGGVYNSAVIETDTTLSVSGKAADGKATGDAIAAVKAAVLAEIAPAYSTSGTYAVGDYVIYNSGLYRCVSAISTAESWTAAHWVSVDLAPDLGGQVSALKTQLKDFTGNEILPVTNPGYYNLNVDPVDLEHPSDGGNDRFCGYFDCNEGDAFIISGRSNGAVANLYAFLDNSRNVIVKYPYNQTADKLTIVAPENSKYLVVNNYQNSVVLVKGYNIPNELYLEKYLMSIIFGETNIRENLWDYGGYSSTDGEYIFQGSRLHTQLNKNIISCSVASNFVYSIHGWDGQTYLGTYNGQSFEIRANPYWTNEEFDITKISAYTLQVVIRKTTLEQLSKSDSSNFYVITNVDTTLTKKGFAADAQETGKDIRANTNSINNEIATREYITNNKRLYADTPGWLNLNTSPISLTPISNAERKCGYFECNEGDVFTISGESSGTGARIFAFVDNSLNVLYVADYNITLTNQLIIAPKNSKYLVVNNYNDTLILYKGLLVRNRINLYEGYKSPSYFSSLDDIPVITQFDALISLYDELTTKYPNYVTKHTLTSGNFSNYEYVFTTGNFNEHYGQRTHDNEIPKPIMLIISGVHGDERSSITSLYVFAKYLCECESLAYLRNNYTIKMIPCVCPSGFNNNTRTNANGVNINRNFSEGWYYSGAGTNNFSGDSAADQDETVVVQDWMDNNANAVIEIDWHNSGYTNEICYLGCAKNTEPYQKIKKCYFSGESNIITHWITDRNIEGQNIIYDYTGTDPGGGMSQTYGDSVGIPSMYFETSLEVDVRDSNFTIGTGTEAFAAFVKYFGENRELLS